MTNVLQNLDRWVPRETAINLWREEHGNYSEDGYADAVDALVKSGVIERLKASSFSEPVLALVKAMHSGHYTGLPETAADDDKAAAIVDRARPLLEQHKDEIFRIFVKCLMLELDADTLGPMFYELRAASRHIDQHKAQAA